MQVGLGTDAALPCNCGNIFKQNYVHISGRAGYAPVSVLAVITQLDYDSTSTSRLQETRVKIEVDKS